MWGTTPDSVGRKKYYVSFVDDYSRFVCIYLLKHKSEVFQIHDFQQIVERQFSRKILAPQIDWGGEYKKLHYFSKGICIIHLVSCPHALQQNGPDGIKHRQFFWDEAFSTAAYLINRLPSRVINNDTPLEHPFHTKLDYNFIHIFGCAC
jgi:histone deacetylase 1/2